MERLLSGGSVGCLSPRGPCCCAAAGSIDVVRLSMVLVSVVNTVLLLVAVSLNFSVGMGALLISVARLFHRVLDKARCCRRVYDLA